MIVGMIVDEMVGWHHPLNGYEFEQALGDGEGQGRLAAAVHGVSKQLDDGIIDSMNMSLGKL